METRIDLSDILAYCAAHIEDYKMKERIALNKIDRMRCPFSFCGDFFDEFSECVGEYLLDHDIDEDEFFEEYDIEDVFWAE